MLNKVIFVLIFLVLITNLNGCATAPLRITDFPYIYTEINSPKEDIFNAIARVINEQNLPIAQANKEEGYVATEYIDTISGLTKGLATVISGVTAEQYAYIFEIHSTDNVDKNILITRIILRWKRLGGGFQYFTEISKGFYKETEKIAIRIKEVAEREK